MDAIGLWLVVALLLRVGQMLTLSGVVRSKNSAGMAMRLFVDVALSVVGIWSIGAGFIQTGCWFDSHLIFGASPDAGAVLAILPALLLATGAIHGSSAERTRHAPLIILTIILSVLVIPMLVKIFSPHSYFNDVTISLAGIGSIVGGAAGLVTAKVVGSRKGKFNRDQSVNFIPGHQVLLQIVGTLLIVLGFIASTLGEGAGTVGLKIVEGLVSASFATLAGTTYGWLRFGKLDVGLTIAASVGGICAFASTAQPLPPYAAAALGMIAGVAVPWTVMLIEFKLRIDDPAGSVATYLIGGATGILLAPLFAAGDIKSRLSSIFPASLGLLILIFTGVMITLLTTIIINKLNKLRTTETEEFDGTDLTELDINAYPDFQQTMIKSYHMREV